MDSYTNYVRQVAFLVNKSLQKIINIHWPELMYNKELWKKAGEN